MAIDLIRNLVKCFHNPQVMLQVPQRSYKIEPGLLTDHCGLKVPQHSTAWTFATRASANRCSVLSLRGSGNGKSSCHVWSVEGHGGLQSCHAILTQSCWPGQLKVLEMRFKVAVINYLFIGLASLWYFQPAFFVVFWYPVPIWGWDFWSYGSPQTHQWLKI